MSIAYPIPGPLGVGEILDRAFRLYRVRFGTLLLGAAIFLIPLGILSGAVTGNILVSYFDMVTEMASNPDMTPQEATDLAERFGDAGGSFAASLLVMAAGAVLNGLAGLTLTAMALAALGGREVSLGTAMRDGAGRLVHYLLMLVTEGFVMGAATLAILFPLACGGLGLLLALGAGSSEALATGPSSTAGVAAGTTMVLVVLLWLGLFGLALIPMLYLSARWIAAIPALVHQGSGPLGALGRSWSLTRRQVLRCFGYALLLFLLGQVVTTVLGFLLQIPVSVFAPESVAGMLSGAAGAVGQVLWLPIQAIAAVILYFDLRTRKEGYDLALRVAQLEEAGRPPGVEVPAP